MRKKITGAAIVLFLFTALTAVSVSAGNRTLNGYLADNLCIRSGFAADGANMGINPEDHTVACALMKPCIDSGYAVMVRNGSGGFDVYRLDQRGNRLAVDFLRNLDREADISVRATGNLRGDTLRVHSIEDAL